LSDARLLASVLRDGKFVQTREAIGNKFKSSVAMALHPAVETVPNWNKLPMPCDAQTPQASCQLPLTAIDGAS
jgi:hypothetical protein